MAFEFLVIQKCWINVNDEEMMRCTKMRIVRWTLEKIDATLTLIRTSCPEHLHIQWHRGTSWRHFGDFFSSFYCNQPIVDLGLT